MIIFLIVILLIQPAFAGTINFGGSGGGTTINVNAQGVRVGASQTIAGFPALRPDNNALQVGDYARLTDIDGVNIPGDYTWDGSTWVLSATCESYADNSEVDAGVIDTKVVSPFQLSRKLTELGGTYRGYSTQYANLNTGSIGDIGYLVKKDGANQPGLYEYNGSTYSNVMPLVGGRYNQSITTETVLSQTDMVATGDHYGVYVDATTGPFDIVVPDQLNDGYELTVTIQAGSNTVGLLPTATETIGGGVGGVEINALGTIVLKKNGTNWDKITVSQYSSWPELQPDTADVGVHYVRTYIDTSRETGQNADFNLTTTTNPPIWEVGAVETKANAFSLPGTSASQTITLWIPDGEGIELSSTNAFITDIRARRQDSGITILRLIGANQTIDDSAAFPSLDQVVLTNTGAEFTDLFAKTAYQLTKIVASGTNITLTDAVGDYATNLVWIFANNSNSVFTDALSAKIPITHFSVGDTLTNITDAFAVSSPGLTAVYIQNTPSNITDAFAANATTLDTVYVYNTSSTLTDQFAINSPTLRVLYAYNTNSTFTGALPANGPNLINVRVNNLSLTSANIDAILNGFESFGALTHLHLHGNNQPRTSASDTAFSTLSTQLGGNLLVN